MTFLREWQTFYQELWQKEPKLLELHKISPKHLDVDALIDALEGASYVQDVSSNPSANVESLSVPRLKYEVNCHFFKYLTYRKVFEKATELYGLSVARELTYALLSGKLYLHDASAYVVPYCLGVSFARLFEEGFRSGRLKSLPPKKPKSFINQVKECVIELSNEFAGAIAFPTLIVSYAYVYLKYYGKDAPLREEEIVDDFQNLVHTINKEMRNGVESPFTNLSFYDRFILDELLTYVYGHYLVDLGVEKDRFVEVVMRIQEVVMEFFAKGDPITKGPYPFPVLTANFILDEEGNVKDENFLNLVARYNEKGIFNVYCSKDARKFSSCCRMLSDYSNVKFDSFGNGGVNVGSIKVVTVNLNRIALRVKHPHVEREDDLSVFSDEARRLLFAFPEKPENDPLLNAYLERLARYVLAAKAVLDVFRELLRDAIKMGRLKYFSLKWFDLDKHFYSTIGLIGFYEATKTLGIEFVKSEGKSQGEVVLAFMDFIVRSFNEGDQKWKYNLEQVPGETLASFFPLLDKYFYGEELVPYVIYANQFLPLYESYSVFDKVKVESKYFKYLSGGGIAHVNVAEVMPFEARKEWIKALAKAGVEHFALNPVYSICEKDHYTFGKVESCAYCGSKVKDYVTRVVGFFTKVSKWNKVRREWEFTKRLWFKL